MAEPSGSLIVTIDQTDLHIAHTTVFRILNAEEVAVSNLEGRCIAPAQS
jgi:hypothetical protein